jgi:hypothetical protein
MRRPIMSRNSAIGTTALGAFVLVLLCILLWKNWTRKYIVKWHNPLGKVTETTSGKIEGNVCIIESTKEPSTPLACTIVQFFPAIYDAIGVNGDRLVKWQNENGFHSGGVDRSGALLAPGYPIFSRLAWTLIDPVDLRGDELSGLQEESKRISAESTDPVVKANLERLSELAARAQKESKALRIS